MDKEEFLMSKIDLNAIVDSAKDKYSNKTFPLYLENLNNTIVLVPQHELNILCIIEATIQHLNGKKCLSKLPKFNVKENKLDQE